MMTRLLPLLSLIFTPGMALADPGCLILDPARATQGDGSDRTMLTLAIALEDAAPGPGRMVFEAMFTGPSTEAPDAKPGTIYALTFTCVAGPAEFTADVPMWVLTGGVICTPACGAGSVQVRPQGDGSLWVWTDGISLTEQPSGTCGAGTALTTRGNVGVGYPLIVSAMPGHCAPLDGL
jgi:hypothetical protein